MDLCLEALVIVIYAQIILCKPERNPTSKMCRVVLFCLSRESVSDIFATFGGFHLFFLLGLPSEKNMMKDIIVIIKLSHAAHLLVWFFCLHFCAQFRSACSGY